MSNNLYNNFPQLRIEWNDNIEDMKKYTSGSHKKVSWKCSTNNHCHIWDSNKNNPIGCHYCSIGL